MKTRNWMKNIEGFVANFFETPVTLKFVLSNAVWRIGGIFKLTDTMFKTIR